MDIIHCLHNVGILLLYCCKCFKTNKSNDLNENIIELKNMQLNLPTLNVAPELLTSLSKMLILKWQVRLLDIIGQGYLINVCNYYFIKYFYM